MTYQSGPTFSYKPIPHWQYSYPTFVSTTPQRNYTVTTSGGIDTCCEIGECIKNSPKEFCENLKAISFLIGKLIVLSFPFGISIAQGCLINSMKNEPEKIALYVLGLTINSVYLFTSCFFHCRTYGAANYCKEGSFLRFMTFTGIGGVVGSVAMLP